MIQQLKSYLLFVGLLLAALSSCTKIAPFSTETFEAIDGQKSIKFISGDELELRDRTGNFVCKYTKQGETLRVTESMMGTNRAFYFEIVPGGLRQQDGTIFYSPTALAARRGELRREQEVAENRQRAEQQRLADLRAQSHKETRIVATAKVRDSTTSSHEPAGEATVTDVSIKIRQKLGRENVDRVHWFGDIGPIAEYSQPDQILFTYGSSGMASQWIYAVDQKSGIQLKAALKQARKAWYVKYAEVSNGTYGAE